MRMYLVKRSKYVKPYHNNGFTFIEMIFAFSIFLLIVSLFPLVFQLLSQNGFVEERLQRMEWEVFSAQVKQEVRMCDSLKIENNRMLLRKDKESIMYEKYGSSIRRRVDLKGHEIMLQNIQTVTFEEVIKGVRISVVDQYNQGESITVRTAVDEEGLYGP